MSLDIPSSLVDVNWLNNNIGHDKLIVMDASVPPVVPGFVAINTAEYFSAIPGARRFDYDKKVCKPDSALPHMMPSEDLFQQEVRKLGIDDDSVIVFYDDVGIYASPRAWWMMRAMGHRNVAVLDGGLPAWIDAGLPVQHELSAIEQAGNFVAKDAGGLFCDFDEVLSAIENPSSCIVDADPPDVFLVLLPSQGQVTAVVICPVLRTCHLPRY